MLTLILILISQLKAKHFNVSVIKLKCIVIKHKLQLPIGRLPIGHVLSGPADLLCTAILSMSDCSVLPRLLLQGAAPCPLFVTPCPFEKAEMTPCPFD